MQKNFKLALVFVLGLQVGCGSSGGGSDSDQPQVGNVNNNALENAASNNNQNPSQTKTSSKKTSAPVPQTFLCNQYIIKPKNGSNSARAYSSYISFPQDVGEVAKDSIFSRQGLFEKYGDYYEVMVGSRTAYVKKEDVLDTCPEGTMQGFIVTSDVKMFAHPGSATSCDFISGQILEVDAYEYSTSEPWVKVGFKKNPGQCSFNKGVIARHSLEPVSFYVATTKSSGQIELARLEVELARVKAAKDLKLAADRQILPWDLKVPANVKNSRCRISSNTIYIDDEAAFYYLKGEESMAAFRRLVKAGVCDPEFAKSCKARSSSIYRNDGVVGYFLSTSERLDTLIELAESGFCHVSNTRCFLKSEKIYMDGVQAFGFLSTEELIKALLDLQKNGLCHESHAKRCTVSGDSIYLDGNELANIYNTRKRLDELLSMTSEGMCK